MFKNSYGNYDAELVHIAMRLASELVGNHGYTPDDADDILQSLIVAGISALPQFDSSQGKRSTYLYAVLRNQVINLARYADGKIRDRQKEEFSLDDKWPEDETEETLWEDVIGIENTFTEQGSPRKNRTDLHSLSMDIADALTELPPRLRDLCRFHAYLNVHDARRAVGMAKATHHRAIKRLRAFFEARGLNPQSRKKSGTFRGTFTHHSKGTL